MDVADLFDEFRTDMDLIQRGLLDLVLDGSITRPQNYQRLIRESDGDEYDANKFQEERVARYRAIFLCASREPSKDLVDSTYPLRVVAKH